MSSGGVGAARGQLPPSPLISGLSENFLLVGIFFQQTKFGEKSPVWRKFRDKIEIWSTRNLLRWKFAAFCSPYFFDPSTPLPMSRDVFRGSLRLHGLLLK